jgi:hypothetical protein
LSRSATDEAERPQPDPRQNRRGAEGINDRARPDELGLQVGDDAIAVIKASDVMVAK